MSIYYQANQLKPNRKTLVFLHGLSGSSSAWAKYARRWNKKYNLVVLDLRGHGKSDKPLNYFNYSFLKFSQDLEDLINHLKLKNFILISHSFGTLVALAYLSKHQAKVKAAVFLSPNFLSVPKRKLTLALRAFFRIYQLLYLNKFSLENRRHINYAKFVNTGDWDLSRIYADVKNTSPLVYLHCLKQGYNFKYNDFIEKITIPTLIIHGQKDSIFPISNSFALAKKIKNCRLIILPRANHIIVLNNYLEISKAIEKFLSAIN